MNACVLRAFFFFSHLLFTKISLKSGLALYPRALSLFVLEKLTKICCGQDQLNELIIITLGIGRDGHGRRIVFSTNNKNNNITEKK